MKLKRSNLRKDILPPKYTKSRRILGLQKRYLCSLRQYGHLKHLPIIIHDVKMGDLQHVSVYIKHDNDFNVPHTLNKDLQHYLTMVYNPRKKLNICLISLK